jgi:hypothetical protein
VPALRMRLQVEEVNDPVGPHAPSVEWKTSYGLHQGCSTS